MLFVSVLFVGLFAFESYRIVVAANKTESARSAFLDANELTLAQVSKDQIDILIKIQDPNFYNHNGIDLRTPGAGVTTITQSLTKWMYFENFKPGFAKLEQSLIAKFVLDKQFSKEEQLEIMFNHAYLGHHRNQRISGFAEASRTYFDKEFSEISESEYLSLVAMLVAPNSVHVIKEPEKHEMRVQQVRSVLDGTYSPSGVLDVLYDKNDA